MQNSESFKKNNKSLIYKINIYIYLLVFVLGLSNIIFSNTLATQGVELSRYLMEIKKTNQHVRELQNQLSVLSSLSTIEKKATAMGFVSTKKVITIKQVRPEVASIQP